MMQPTANERFKARTQAWQWRASLLAVAIHIAVFALVPSFRVEAAFGHRMLVSVGPAAAPASAELHRGTIAFDSAAASLVAANIPHLVNRLPRLYPWQLWHYREESSALLQVTVSRSGRVKRAAIVESSGNGGDDALLELARRLKFAVTLPEGVHFVIAHIEIGVITP